MIRDQYVMKIYLLMMMHRGFNNGFVCIVYIYTHIYSIGLCARSHVCMVYGLDALEDLHGIKYT